MQRASCLRCGGLTLVELLVVIAILGLLSSVVLASFTGHRERARDAMRLVAMDQINKAILAYQLQNGVPPGEDGVMYVNGAEDWIPGLVPDFVSVLPVDPRDTTKYSFRYMRQGNDYALVARFEKEQSERAVNDGGVSDGHYEIASGAFPAISDMEESDWRFSAASRVETHLSCPTPGAQVTICHVPPGSPEEAHTVTVACTALGPEGHSNHPGDYLGPCTLNGSDGGEDATGDDGPPADEPPADVGSTCPVTVTPTQNSYVSGGDVQLAWESTCYPSNSVMLEVRKVGSGGSQPYIMITSWAGNDGDYPYQGFPSGLIGGDQWVVRVTDQNQRTIWHESLSFIVTGGTTDTTPPSAPGYLYATMSAAYIFSEVDLFWGESTDDVGVAGYRLYRDGVAVSETMGTTHTDTGLSPETSYSYTVTAYDEVGNESPHTAPFVATTIPDYTDDNPPPEEEESCPVTITPAQSSYVSGDDVQLSWDSTCYPSNNVMLEVRKVTGGESASYIMIYSFANNDGDYPYQGFPSGLVGSDEWVVRVTDYNTRTNWDESAAFEVVAQ